MKYSVGRTGGRRRRPKGSGRFRATLCSAVFMLAACAHAPPLPAQRVVVGEVKAAIEGCDVSYFEPWMTPAAREVFGGVARQGRAMLTGLETLKSQVESRYGVKPETEPDGSVIFPEAVQVGAERADARINLGFSIAHECSLLGIYGEEVLLRDPEVSGPCGAVTLPHSSIAIVRAQGGCEIDLSGSAEDGLAGRDVLRLFVSFLEEQNHLLKQDPGVAYGDWGGLFMGSFKATVAQVQARLKSPVAAPAGD